MNLRRLLLNMGSAVVQVLISAGLLFVVYGYIVRIIGVELFGVWATVAAAASVAGIGGLGLTGGVVKYVAKYRALDDPLRVCLVISTSLLSGAGALGVMSIAGGVLLPYFLPLLMREPAQLQAAVEIVPYVAVSFWLSSTSAVLVSGLDGFNRVDLRAGIHIGTMILYVVLVFVLLPIHGLVGLVEAQIVQGTTLLLATWIVLGRLTAHRVVVPLRWSSSVFKEIFQYGVNFQIIGIAQILFEPTTKALLTRFAGTGATGIFEMANRLAFQARTVIDSAHRTIVPSLAELHELEPPALPEIYAKSARILVLVGGSSLSLILLGLPPISAVWLGRIHPQFMALATALTVAWTLNIMATPAYYANMGTGQLRWNVIGAVLTAVLNAPLGLVLGSELGVGGVVAAFVVSLLFGNALTVWEHHRRHPECSGAFFDRGDGWFVTACILVSVAAVAGGSATLSVLGLPSYAVAAVLVFAAVIAPAIARHSGFRHIEKTLWSSS